MSARQWIRPRVAWCVLIIIYSILPRRPVHSSFITVLHLRAQLFGISITPTPPKPFGCPAVGFWSPFPASALCNYLFLLKSISFGVFSVNFLLSFIMRLVAVSVLICLLGKITINRFSWNTEMKMMGHFYCQWQTLSSSSRLGVYSFNWHTKSSIFKVVCANSTESGPV